jgi:hypothetical protein
MKHTKGPWSYGYSYLEIVSQSRTKHIATVHCSSKHPATEDESRANSNLIAAAPEMLEVLQNIEKVGMSIRHDSVIWHDIRNAIAKAEGR